MVQLNLGKYLEQARYESVKMSIEKCPDKEAYMVATITNTLINVTSGSETMSMMSGALGADAMSMDSGPESEFKFQDIETDTAKKNNPEEKKDGAGRKIRMPRNKSAFATGHGLPRAPMMKLTDNSGGGINAEEIIESKKPLKLIKVDKSKIKFSQEPEESQSENAGDHPVSSKIKLKLKDQIQIKLQEKVKTDYLTNLTHQKQIDSLLQDKQKLNDNYQR
jgi:hypothetical protein